MIIANPIYDVVFKRLMENDKVAKFFIGTLMEKEIATVEVKPQEFTYVDELAGLAVYRLDFIATIKTNSGEYKKILIEIQKAKNYTDLMRFRNYLGENYKKQDIIDDKKIVLPITTIYLLGFTLPEISSPCIKVERNYWDLIDKKVIDEKSDFIEKLTHDSFVVQVNKISNRYLTRLDKLLSVFEQTNFVDDKKIIKEFNHQTDIEEVELITEILHHSGTNPEERKKIETEQEAWRTVDAMAESLREKVEEQSKAIKEKDQALTEKNQELTEKDQALTEKDKLIAELLRKLNENDETMS